MTSSESIFHHSHFHLVKTPKNTNDNLVHDYCWLEMSPAVMVLAWNNQKELRLCKEWRHPVGGWIVGLPGGGFEKDELSLECAKRELREEAGVISENWHWVGQMRPFPGITNQRVDVWAAFDAKETGVLDLDPGERIEPFWLDPSQLFAISQAAMESEENPSMTLDGILAASLWMFEQKFPSFRV